MAEEEIGLEEPTPTEDIQQEPTTDPTPEPDPAPEPEVEEPIDLSWLEDDPDPPQPPPAPVPQQQPQVPQYQQQPQYPPQQPQYPAPHQSVPQAPQEPILEHLLRDPNAALSNVVNQNLNQTMGPIASRIMDVEHQQRQILEAQTNRAIDSTRVDIEKNVKDIVHKDEAFRTSPEIKARVNAAFKSMHQQAIREAKYGNDFRKLQSFSDPKFYAITLAAAKIQEEYSNPKPGGFTTQTRTEQSSAQATADPSVTIDADMEDALSRLGEAKKQQYIDVMTNHPDDISFD